MNIKTIIIYMKTWEKFFNQLQEKDYFKSLNAFLDSEYEHEIIYPNRENLFKAFELTDDKTIKAVIIGQDPYHEPGQAMGLSFSVPSGTKLPPSLQNIYKELKNDLGIEMRQDGDLTYLAKQGVLLINAYLTVRKGQPLSHHKKEYELLMIDLMKYIDKLEQPIVFMLWGNFAQKFDKYLQNPNHLIIKTTHPSPFGVNHGGWFNMHQFSTANQYLRDRKVEEIKWQN